MTRPRIFSEPTTASTSDDPIKRFDALASKVLAISKDEIDKRETDWQRERKRQKAKRKR